jgi:uncharacterized phage protein (TIGR02218 family)
MLTASASTINILSTNALVRTVDLFDITPPGDATIRWSGGDRPFTIGANQYIVGPLINRTKTKRKVGVDVDSITVTVMDDGSTLYKGRPLLQCIRRGEFTGSLVTLNRLFLASWSDVSPGVVPWFFGYVSEVTGDQGSWQLKVKSMLGYLDLPMPKSLYMPTCNNTFGDAACTKDKAALTESGTVGGGSTTKIITLTGPAHAGTDGYFELGVIKILTGPNAGLTRTVREHTGGSVVIAPALPLPPAAGDSIQLYPSCHKTDDDCTIKYNNLPRNRGYPYVPAPATLYSAGKTPGSAPQAGTGRPVMGTRGGAYSAQQDYVQ